MDQILLGIGIVFLATVAQAVTGFGFALVLVPLLSLVFEPRLVVMMSLSLGLVCKLPLILQTWRDVQPLKIARLSVAAVVGAIAGTQVLLTINADVMRVVIGVVVIALSTPILLEWTRPLRHERLATVLVGFASGSITGATSMGGPPVVLFGVNQAWGKAHLRANLLAFLFVSGLTSLSALFASSALTMELLRTDLFLVAGVLLGLPVGTWLFTRLPAGPFRKLVIALVITSGVVSTTSGLRALIG